MIWRILLAKIIKAHIKVTGAFLSAYQFVCVKERQK